MIYYSQEHQNKFQIGFCKPDFGVIKGQTRKKQENIMDRKSQNLVTQFRDESKVFLNLGIFILWTIYNTCIQG